MIRIARRNLFLAVLLILSVFFLTLHLALALRPPRSLMMWFHIDDAYYYFQVARNVTAGRGFTFDGIGLSNGFHPLWMLVNIPVFYFARFNPYLPFRILVMVSAVITLGGGWLLFSLLRRALHPVAALLGFAAWLFFWPLHIILTQTGMETGLNAFCLLLFLWTINKTDWGASPNGFLWLGCAAAGLLFARLDNIFLVVLVGLWLVFHQQPMRNLLMLDMLVWFITVFTSLVLRVGIDARLTFLPAAEVFFAALAVTRGAAFYALGLYRNPHDFPLQKLLLRLLTAVAVSSAILLLLMLGLLELDLVRTFPRSVVFIEAVLSLVLTGLIRIGFRQAVRDQAPADLSFKVNVHTWLRRGMLYLWPIIALLGAYLFWDQRTFGTPMPISGQIKQWWGTLLTVYGRKHHSLWTIFGILPNTREDPQPWFLIQKYLFQPLYDLFQVDPLTQSLPFLAIKFSLAAVYVSLLVWIYSKHSQEIRRIFHNLSFTPLLTAAVLVPLYYAFTGYLAARDWYWVPQIIVTIFLFLILIHTALTWAEKRGQFIRYLRILPLVLIVLLPLSFSLKALQRFPLKPDETNTHDTLKITHYLEANTPEGSLIGLTGGGTEAYFIQGRTIINLDGLINSKAYFDYVRSGHGSAYLDQIGLDYVLGESVVLFHSDPYEWTFSERLEKIGTLEKYGLFRYSAP